MLVMHSKIQVEIWGKALGIKQDSLVVDLIPAYFLTTSFTKPELDVTFR
jgi:hypothetical protein